MSHERMIHRTYVYIFSMNLQNFKCDLTYADVTKIYHLISFFQKEDQCLK